MNHLACGYCSWTGYSLHEMVTHVGSVHLPPPPKRFYARKEVAEIMGITASALGKRVKAGTLPAEKEDMSIFWMVAESIVRKLEKGVSLKHGN